MLEARPGLLDYWHDRYTHELITRHQIIEVLALPVSAEEKVAEIARIATWGLPK